MPEKSTIAKLKKAGFFTHQDSIETNIAFQADKAKEVMERFHELVEFRGIPSTTLKRTLIDTDEYIIVSKKITPEVTVQVASLIKAYGKDLQLSISFAHHDAKASGSQTTLATVLIMVGAFFVWTGVGAIGLIIGIILAVGAKNKFRDEFESQRNTFYSTVLEILGAACEEAGVDFEAKPNFS